MAVSSSQRLYFIHLLTPLHVGGDQGLGPVDLPTLREVHTEYPLVPGSSVKGVLREACELARGVSEPDVLAAFGPPSEVAGDYRGGLVVGDALLIALPVRSLAGTFAWATCPFALRRLARDLQESGVRPGVWSELAVVRAPGALIPASGQGGATRLSVGGHLFLEDFVLPGAEDPRVTALGDWLSAQIWPRDDAARRFLLERLCLVGDDLFNFLARNALEIRTRVRIDDDTGTAATSGPWSEEHIPAEALLCGVVGGRPTLFRERRKGKEQEGKDAGTPERADALYQREERRTAATALSVLDALAGQTLRFGGKASVGLGRARFQLGAGGGR